MSSTFSPNKNLELMLTGEDDGTWGIKTDNNLSILDLSLGGRLNLALTNANVTLTAAQAQNLIYRLTGALSANVTITFPATGGLYVIGNNTTGAFTVTIAMAGGGATVVVPQGARYTITVNPDSTLGVGLVANNLAGTGTVTSITAGAGITCSPNPITGTGTISATAAAAITALYAGNGITLSPNPITTGAGTVAVAPTINTTTIISSNGSLQVNGGDAFCYFTSNGVRQWYLAAINNGQFWFTDNSAGIVTASIGNGNGQWTWNYPGVFNSNLTVGGSVQVNGNYNCNNQTFSNTLVANAITSNNTLYVAGGSTLVGQINCNNIVCAAINTQGNQITSGTISCGYLTTNNNQINCGPLVANGVVTCVNGINYSNLDGAHTIGFGNSGATLTFYALGGTTASWTFSTSDERWKKNIGPAKADALADIGRLRLISYDLPSQDDTPSQHFDCGFSAQNVQSVTPELVTKMTVAEGKEQLVLDTMAMLSRCVGAIQQLAARIEALEAKLA